MDKYPTESLFLFCFLFPYDPPPPPPTHTHTHTYTNTCDGIVTSIRQLDQVVQLAIQSDTALCKLGITDGAREDQQQETRNGCRGIAKGGGRNLKEGGEQRNSNGHWEEERGKRKNL